jgi:hypothetical protein
VSVLSANAPISEDIDKWKDGGKGGLRHCNVFVCARLLQRLGHMRVIVDLNHQRRLPGKVRAGLPMCTHHRSKSIVTIVLLLHMPVSSCLHH